MASASPTPSRSPSPARESQYKKRKAAAEDSKAWVKAESKKRQQRRLAAKARAAADAEAEKEQKRAQKLAAQSCPTNLALNARYESIQRLKDAGVSANAQKLWLELWHKDPKAATWHLTEMQEKRSAARWLEAMLSANWRVVKEEDIATRKQRALERRWSERAFEDGADGHDWGII